MKKILLLSITLFVFSCLTTEIFAQSAPANTWSKHKAKKWFKKKEWLQGIAITPHKAINKTEFARQYHANKSYWDKAFAFIKEHDVQTMTPGRYVVDSSNALNAYIIITEVPLKDFDKTQWESHRQFIDVHYVVTGEEKMGMYPFTKLTVTKPYDETKDLINYSGDGEIYTVPAGTFIIFFPSDAHRPNITPGGNKVVRKVVMKIRVAE
jgi:biofilm protein TabA